MVQRTPPFASLVLVILVSVAPARSQDLPARKAVDKQAKMFTFKIFTPMPDGIKNGQFVDIEARISDRSIPSLIIRNVKLLDMEGLRTDLKTGGREIAVEVAPLQREVLLLMEKHEYTISLSPVIDKPR